MRWLCAGLFAVMTLAGAHGASAQQIIGQAVIEGRVIEILSDGTWRFVNDNEITGECDRLTLRLAFCGEASGWTSTTPPAPDIVAQYRHDDRHYGQMIPEGLGAADQITLDFMRNAVLENAAAASGQPRSAIEVLESFQTSIAGIDGETIVYRFSIDGLPVVFANAILIGERDTFQIVTFAIGSEFTPNHANLHKEFLSLTQIDQ